MMVLILCPIFVYLLFFIEVENYQGRLEQTVSYNNAKSFYDWFFQNVRTLHVVKLMGENRNISCLVNLDDLLIAVGVAQRNIQIFEESAKEDEIENDEYSNVNFYFERNHSDKFKIEDENELRMYADFNRGFVLVSASTILAIDYLNHRERTRKFYHRDISVVLITDTACRNKHWQRQIFRFLETAWRKHGLLNMIVQTVCDFTHMFYVYRPLVFQNGTYGLLDKYQLEDILSEPRVILNSLKSLNNISLKVNMFYRYPTAVEINTPQQLSVSTCFDVLSYSRHVGGIDGCTLGHLAKYLNFIAIIEDIKGQGINRFGHILPNGSSTGSLGDIIGRKTDIAMNGVFLEYKYSYFNVEFSQVTQSDRICPVVPKSGEIPAWACILKVFSVLSWIFIIIIAVIMCILIDLLSSRSSTNLYYVFFKTVSIDFTNSLEYRVVLAVYLFVFHVILAGIFNGHLFKSFSTVSYYPDINSLQDLADSDLLIETTLNILDDNEKESHLMRLLSRKVVKNYDGVSPAIERAAFYKNIVSLEREGEAVFKINTKYLDQNSAPLLHVLDDCIMTHFISRILPEGSPFLLIFNEWFSRFQESGLTSKWSTSPYLPRKNVTVISGVSARLGLNKLALVFAILFTGLVASFLCLIIELVVHKIQIILKK